MMDNDDQNVADQRQCHLPPVGWYCTRNPGHDGPCAAVQATDGASIDTLPPLPEAHLKRGPGLTPHYTKHQMRDYAAQAVADALAEQAEQYSALQSLFRAQQQRAETTEAERDAAVKTAQLEGHEEGWKGAMKYVAEQAALAQVAGGQVPVNAWQPIATAPRDGTNIIVRFGQDGISQAMFVPGLPHPWKFIDTNNGLSWLINHAVDGLGGPSHWKPMLNVAPVATPQPAPVAGSVDGWANGRLPNVPENDHQEFIVACKRASGKTHIFSANYLNRKNLVSRWDDDTDETEDGTPCTGWFLEKEVDGDNVFELVCTDGDEITHWQEMPNAPDATPPAISTSKGAAPTDEQLIALIPAHTGNRINLHLDEVAHHVAYARAALALSDVLGLAWESTAPGDAP